jgi:hypothetical protein
MTIAEANVKTTETGNKKSAALHFCQFFFQQLLVI